MNCLTYHEGVSKVDQSVIASKAKQSVASNYQQVTVSQRGLRYETPRLSL